MKYLITRKLPEGEREYFVSFVPFLWTPKWTSDIKSAAKWTDIEIAAREQKKVKGSTLAILHGDQVITLKPKPKKKGSGPVPDPSIKIRKVLI